MTRDDAKRAGYETIDCTPPHLARCQSCGEMLTVGSWPFCKGGHGRPALVVIDDTLPGHWVDTLGHEDVWIESRSQLRREAEARGLVNVVRHDDAYYAKQRRMKDEEHADTRASQR